jgi:hypothetical protein
VVQDDSVLIFDSNISFKDDAKFRAQSLEMELYVPYNHEFFMHENLKHVIRNTIYRSGFSVSQMEGNTWVFTEAGLRCLTCEHDEEEDDDEYYYSGNFEKSFETGPFTGLDVGDDFIVNIRQGDSVSINLVGEEPYVNEVLIENDGGLLKIGFDQDQYLGKKKNRGIEVNLTVSELDEVHFSGVSKVSLNDIQVENLQIVLSGASVVEGSLNVSGHLELEMNGGSKLVLEGKGNYLNAELGGGSVLNSLYFEAENVMVEAGGASSAKVFASSALEASSSGSSEIQYRGDPTRTNLDEQAGSSISEY